MFLLLQHYYDVTRLQTRFLVTFAPERHFLALLHPFINVNLQYFLSFLRLLPITVLAPVLGVDSLPLSVAITTHLLNLLYHARSDLVNFNLDTLTSAHGTGLRGTGLPTPAVALVTDDVLVQGQTLGDPVVHIVQGHW